MSQVALQRPCIGSLVRQSVASSMSEHVRVDLKRYLGRDAGTLDQLLQPRHREWRPALTNEDERRLRLPL